MWHKWTLGIAGLLAAIFGLGSELGAFSVSRIDADRLILGAVLLALNGALIWRVERLLHLHQDDYDLSQTRRLSRRNQPSGWKQRLLVGVDWLE
jgi:hypothetical protein